MIKRSFIVCFGFLLLMNTSLSAQEKALTNTSKSKYSRLQGVDILDVKWTNGFWADRFRICRESMVPHMLAMYMDDSISHGFANFEIAAGRKNGEHIGPPFHDGDFYKLLEALIVVNAHQKDKKTEAKIDAIIEIIGETQRTDGYIHTPVVISERLHPEKMANFSERMDFETYNMGHLQTAACIHYRLTGKRNLLDIAVKATDFLYHYYKKHAFELAQNAICPSHYMGVVEMYRTVGDERYLELAKGLVDIRTMVENGEDHNQDRIPFREQTKAIGHAVRANYLYAGVADLYSETGDESLLKPLKAIWDDLVSNKMYITGACGALYDGVSPNGTTYDQPLIQQIHQAYGQDYELPNLTAHNESCANIGNLLWNWRMFQLDGGASYADVMEQVMYNSLLAGISLDGIRHFYTNPLAVSTDLPYALRWSKNREEYISYCNCCPPNTIRTIAEISGYMYSKEGDNIWVNFYGANRLSTKLANGQQIELEQKTNYPWDGNVTLEIKKNIAKETRFSLRIPGWCTNACLKVNGKVIVNSAEAGTYVSVSRTWQKGDRISLHMPMEVLLMESNPLVEENRNQVALRRGPVVYCLESADLPRDVSVFQLAVNVGKTFDLEKMEIDGAEIIAIMGEGQLLSEQDWGNHLYRPMSLEKQKNISLKFVPYYAWNNRGIGEMSVWIPVKR